MKPRPCTCRRRECHLCFLADRTREYHGLFGGPLPRNPRPIPAVPGGTDAPTPRPECVHLGPEIEGHSRQRLGLSHARTWYVCGKGHGKEGAVARCLGFPRGCAGCPAYSRTE